MQQLQPDHAHFLLHGFYLPGLKNEHNITKGIFGAIPLDKGEYRPDDISRGALDLAWHIAATEMRFMAALPAGEFDFTPRHRPDSVKNSAELTRWYKDQFEMHFDELTKLSDEQLLKVIDFRSMFHLPAVMYLGFLLHHSVHHRGQLSMYLRPMGAKVPAIYGESYDSAEARKASSQSV